MPHPAAAPSGCWTDTEPGRPVSGRSAFQPIDPQGSASNIPPILGLAIESLNPTRNPYGIGPGGVPLPMDQLRLGTVEYLNTEPLLHGLETVGGLENTRAVPSRIIDLLLGDRVDVGLISLIDVARSPVPLTILPVGMIGCDGPTLTVRLFSAGPIDRIRRVHADTDSHTSVALARLILHDRFGLNPEIVDYDARERFANQRADDAEDWPDTVLLIGDKVVSDSPPAVRYPYQLDLGEAWHQKTGLPFVYAVWACRADRADEPRIRAGAALLDRVRRRNAMRPDQIVNTSAGPHGWPTDLARQYLGRYLRFDFGARELEAARTFLRLAAEAGQAPSSELRVLEIGDFVPTPG